MKVFTTLEGNEYNIEKYNTSAPISWQLLSSSAGTIAISPTGVDRAIKIHRANKNAEYYNDTFGTRGDINSDTGLYEYILYKSIKSSFYQNRTFYSASVPALSSIAPLADKSYVIDIGQKFYGNNILPGTFTLSVGTGSTTVKDDFFGNLYLTQSGITYYVGNIFYDDGIAVIKQDSASLASIVSTAGMNLLSGSTTHINYNSNIINYRHEVIANIQPMDFNFAFLNPSIIKTANTSSIQSGSLYQAMLAGEIPPYVTTIGLYNDQDELLAVAKLSSAIQRTFDTNQIFIIRFDT